MIKKQKRTTKGPVLKRTVKVSVVVTDQFKKDSDKDIKARIDRLDKTMAQIDKQTQPYVAELKKTGKLKQLENLKRQVAQEKGKLALQKKVLQKKSDEIFKLTPGTEYPRGNMESWVEINVGDDFNKKVGGMEIVLKDGIVKEIRRS